jgi:hypothetical protein
MFWVALDMALVEVVAEAQVLYLERLVRRTQAEALVAEAQMVEAV